MTRSGRDAPARLGPPRRAAREPGRRRLPRRRRRPRAVRQPRRRRAARLRPRGGAARRAEPRHDPPHPPDGTPFPEEECPLLRPRATGETVRVDHDWFVRRDGGLVPVAYSSAPVHDRRRPRRGRGVPRHLRARRAQAERVRAAELARVARPDRGGRRRRAPAARARPPRRRAGTARQRRDRAAARRRSAAATTTLRGRRARRAAHRDGRAARPRLRAAPLRPHEPRPGRGGRDADGQGPAAGRRVGARRPLRRDRRGRRVLRRRRGAGERRQARRGHGGVGRDRAATATRSPSRSATTAAAAPTATRAAACAGWRIASPRSTARWRWTARRAAGPASARACRSLRRAQQREHRHHAPVLVVRVADVELGEDVGHVLLDGGEADDERLRDALVGLALGHEPEDLALARR